MNEQPLDRLIVFARNEKGTILELSKRLGVKRQQVEQWLNPDPDKRVEPKLAVGLLLIAEGDKLMGEKAA